MDYFLLTIIAFTFGWIGGYLNQREKIKEYEGVIDAYIRLVEFITKEKIAEKFNEEQ